MQLNLFLAGDVLEQNLEIYRKELEKLDGIRTRNMAASGLTVGVFCHYWFVLTSLTILFN